MSGVSHSAGLGDSGPTLFDQDGGQLRLFKVIADRDVYLKGMKRRDLTPKQRSHYQAELAKLTLELMRLEVAS